MLDPESTKVLPRRILASLIDLGIVGILSALIIKLTAITYTDVERNTDGTWQQTAAQFKETQGLSVPSLVRVQEFGDKIVIFGGFMYWIGLLFVLLLALLVFVLLPATMGSSPGKRLTGLRVVNDEGESPKVSQYILRTLVGLVDFLPFGGILGWVVASNDLHSRRLGDRFAGTAVVDAREDLRFVDEIAWRRQREALDNPLLAENPADLDSMVALDDRLNFPGTAMGDDDAHFAAPDLDMPDVAMPDVAMPDVEIPDLNMPDPDMPDLDTPDLDMPDLNASDPDIADIADTKAPLPSRRMPEPATGEWEQPVGTDSPVWDPALVTADQSEPQVDLLAQQAASQNRQAQLLEAERAAQQTEAQQAATTQAEAIDPLWSAEWNAWLYWDAQGDRWLRHDVPANAWVPIS